MTEQEFDLVRKVVANDFQEKIAEREQRLWDKINDLQNRVDTLERQARVMEIDLRRLR